MEEVEEPITPTAVEDTEEVEEVATSIAPAVETTEEVEEVEEPITSTDVDNTETLEEDGYEEENDELLTRGRENVGVVFGVTCVFKPYYDGYELDDLLEIPVSKQRFETLKERKQIKIFKRAEKKREKNVKKQ